MKLYRIDMYVDNLFYDRAFSHNKRHIIKTAKEVTKHKTKPTLICKIYETEVKWNNIKEFLSKGE